MRDYYTKYPRPLLWLVAGGEVGVDGGRVGVEPFYLSKLPVTNRELEAAALGWERDPLAAGDDDPALGVDLDTARAYCSWYAEVSRKPMRLPTEAEWRSALDPAPGPPELEEQAWHAGNSEGASLPRLDDKRANANGFYGLLGGAWEWVTGAGGEPLLVGGSFRTPAEGLLPPPTLDPADHSPPPETAFRVAKPLRRP